MQTFIYQSVVLHKINRLTLKHFEQKYLLLAGFTFEDVQISQLIHYTPSINANCSTLLYAIGRSKSILRILVDITIGVCEWSDLGMILSSVLFVRLSVTLCIMALGVGVGGSMLYHCVPRRALPIHFFRHFCCRMYRLAIRTKYGDGPP